MNMAVIDDERLGEGREELLGLPLKTGVGQERTLPVRAGQTLLVILEVIAAERGCAVEELIIIREGAELPLDPGTVVDHGYPHHRRHHVHHRAQVKVDIYYGAGSKHHSFNRHATVEAVLDWAIGAFTIDPTAAPDFALATHGTTTEVPPAEHLGHLAGHHHELAFDLVRGALVNGSAR